MTATPLLASSSGIWVTEGPPDYKPIPGFKKDEAKSCRCMRFSPDGKFFAWTNGIQTADFSNVAEYHKPKAQDICFSPNGTYMAVFELYSKINENDVVRNLSVFRTETGELLHEFEQRKQDNWQPQWTNDEVYCSRNVKNDILFYKSEDFSTVAHKLANQRVQNYGLSPGKPNSHVLAYVPGKSGQPSHGKLYQVPDFNRVIANKSFFQADRVEMFWNKKGTAVLMFTSVEVDKTGSNYYGKQGLHFLSIKGDTSIVQLNKEGPIHNFAWSPQSTEFCVVYGFMPAKATIFNLKAEPVFELGTGPRNSIYYNPHGNILLIGGFGNIQGNVELWEPSAKKFINKIKAPDTTMLSWSPDGLHFATATTAPRLRICNGFKVWHHSGTLVYEQSFKEPEELWEIAWQNFPTGTFKTPAVSYQLVKGVVSQEPTASKEPYRPPKARGKPPSFTIKLEEDLIPGTVLSTKPLSKAAAKNKKKREVKKAKVDDNAEQDDDRSNLNDTLSEYTSEDPEKRKAKLNRIGKLKEQEKEGKQLETNQLELVKSEQKLLQQLSELCV